MDTNPNSSDNHSPDSANLLPRSIDWAAIHLAYTTSSSSTRDIGRAHGVTHAAIGKRARREGWERPEKEEPVSAKLAKLAPMRARAVDVDRKDWAHSLLARHDAGEKLRPISLRFAREALRINPKQGAHA